MSVTPGALGRRYSPLLVLAAVQLMLVLLSPSTPTSTTAFAGGGSTGGRFAPGSTRSASRGNTPSHGTGDVGSTTSAATPPRLPTDSASTAGADTSGRPGAPRSP